MITSVLKALLRERHDVQAGARQFNQSKLSECDLEHTNTTLAQRTTSIKLSALRPDSQPPEGISRNRRCRRPTTIQIEMDVEYSVAAS